MDATPPARSSAAEAVSSAGSSSASLQRRLGLPQAIVIGLGSMIGAGVFVAFAPAAQVAGSWLLLGLALAALAAFCNATSTAQLAAQHPVAGGAYAYGRLEIHPAAGLLAGWGFLLGKTASVAAMALVVAYYIADGLLGGLVAALVLITMTTINILGVQRTAAVTAVIVAIVLAALVLAVIAVAVDDRFSFGVISSPAALYDEETGLSAPGGFSLLGVLQAAGLLFFAFAGYARIATLGEEVRDPARTIPRAVLIVLGLAAVVYAVIAVMLLGVLGPGALARDLAPVLGAVQGIGWAETAVRIGAAVASLGALLGLLAGLGRTAFAMARDSAVFEPLARVHPRFGTPWLAEAIVCAVAIVLVFTVHAGEAIVLSSTGVLVYYFIANLAAFRQDDAHRRWPRWVQLLGMVLCLVLAGAMVTVWF